MLVSCLINSKVFKQPRVSQYKSTKKVSPLFIVLADVKQDLGNEFFFRVPDAAADDITAEDVKPDFHLIEPGGIGGLEVQGQPPPLSRPFSNFLMFVGVEIIDNPI